MSVVQKLAVALQRDYDKQFLLIRDPILRGLVQEQADFQMAMMNISVLAGPETLDDLLAWIKEDSEGVNPYGWRTLYGVARNNILAAREMRDPAGWMYF